MYLDKTATHAPQSFDLQRRTAMPQAWNARTGLDLSLLRLADDELVELLLVFGAEVLQALLGLGGDLKLVHGGGRDVCGATAVGAIRGVRRWLG